MADSQKKSANIITGQIDNSVIYTNGVVSSTNDYTTLYAPVTAGSEYSFEFTSSDVDSAYVYGFFTALPTMGSTTYNNSRTVKNYTQNPTITVTIPDTCTYIGIRIPNTALAQGKDVMLNAGSSVLPYEPHTSTGWLHSLRKLTTATEAVENPLYSDGTAITAYTLKGNEEHTGTPSPQNPVMPNGVGVRTENYFNVQNYVANITTHSCTVSAAANGVKITATGSDAYAGEAYKSPDGANSGDSQAAIPVEENTSYVLSADVDTFTDCYISYLNSSYKALNANYTKIGADVPATFTTPTGTAYVALRLGSKSLGVGQSKTFANITLTKNGLYKIPISSANTTTNIYLGEVETTRQIKQLVLDSSLTFTKNSGSATNYLYHTPIMPAINDCLCTHLQLSATNPVDVIGIRANPSRELVYLNFGADVMNAQPSGNTPAGLKEYLESQKSNGTPVTVWYVLATPETATLDEPLMKIGNYADTLSNAASIPTTEGANSITVDTTVQPSEFTATWTGWHNAYVKEKSENLFSGVLLDGYTDENYEQAGNLEVYKTIKISLPAGTYTVSFENPVNIVRYIHDNLYEYNQGTNVTKFTFTTTTNNYVYLGFRLSASSTTPWDNSNIMLNTGSTALPYEPYWK